MTRKDALPETAQYRDTGCDLYSACLSCPLPVCQYELPRYDRPEMVRNAAIVALAATQDARQIAEQYGISTRSVFRILKESRENNGR